MRKFFLFALLVTATTLFAETKVETFNTKDGSVTNTYVTTVTTKECQQASWTFFSGGILKNLGDMGGDNYAAVIRAKKAAEEVYPYMESSVIDGGIDSLWFTWNSNGNETGGTWNVVIYINGDSIGAITGAGGPKAAAPFNTYSVGNLNITGEFTIKFVNLSPYSGSGNSMRFVFDNLSWEPKAAAGEKTKPQFEYAVESLIKKVGAEAFVNPLTNTSDGVPTFESSNPEVATVAEDGTVSIVGVGYTTITASVAETETFKPAEASYELRVVPVNFNLETFDGAQNATGNATYHTNDSIAPTSNAGITWTTHLGSIRGALGGSGATNMAAVIRAMKKTESKYGYLMSDSIEGGIDALVFEWNSNGNESGRANPWNIKIYINDVEVGAITDACTAIQPAGEWYQFSVSNLQVAGKFVLKIENLNIPDDSTSNQYRFVLDNIEWYSYEASCEYQYGLMVDGEDYIAGVREDKGTYDEYKIEVELEAGQTIQLYDNCAQVAFLPNGQEEGGYWFVINDGVWSAPAAGKYTVYLKMYGFENNWIWTAYEELPTDIENNAIKADVRKAVEDGMVVIYRNGVRYNLQGTKF